jgi:hypothetical protein
MFLIQHSNDKSNRFRILKKCVWKKAVSFFEFGLWVSKQWLLAQYLLKYSHKFGKVGIIHSFFEFGGILGVWRVLK